MQKEEMRRDKFYVYEHWLDGICFYVGKGRKERPFEFYTRRNKFWTSIVNERYDEIQVKLIREFDDSKSALAFETELTKYYIEKGMCKANNFRCGNSFFGKHNPFYGKHHSEETIKKIKKKNSGKFEGENNPFYGKKHSKETLELISAKSSKPVYCVELDRHFKNIQEATHFLGIKNASMITKAIKQNRKYKDLTFKFDKKQGGR